MLKARLILFLILMFLLDTNAQQKEKLVLSSGAFGILDKEKVFMGSLDLLIGEKGRIIVPKVGVMFTSENSIYTYLGFNLSQPIFFGFSLSFSFAPGLYYSFRKDILGHVLEFNSGMEISYSYPDQSEISLSFHHISNGGLSKFNPGAEFILISYSFPLRKDSP